MEPERESLNWVLARDDCSTAAAFDVLCNEIEKDVDTRNSLSNETAYVYLRDKEDILVVTRKADEKRVTFRLKNHQIIATGYRIRPLNPARQRVFITRLNNSGACELIEVGAVLDRPIVESTLDALFFDSQTDRPRFP